MDYYFGFVGSYFNGRMPGSDPGDRGSIPRDPPSFLLFVFSGLVGPCINGTFMGLSIGHFFYGRIVDFESRNVGSIRTGTLPCSSLLWCNGSHMALRRSKSKFNSWLELLGDNYVAISIAGSTHTWSLTKSQEFARLSRDTATSTAPSFLLLLLRLYYDFSALLSH